MRSPTQGSLTQILPGQITVKGSYKHSLAGTYFDLYVLSPDGNILGNQTIAIRKGDQPGEANERLKHEIARVAEAVKLYKVDSYKHLTTQQQAVQYILRVLFPRTN